MHQHEVRATGFHRECCTLSNNEFRAHVHRRHIPVHHRFMRLS